MLLPLISLLMLADCKPGCKAHFYCKYDALTVSNWCIREVTRVNESVQPRWLPEPDESVRDVCCGLDRSVTLTKQCVDDACGNDPITRDDDVSFAEEYQRVTQSEWNYIKYTREKYTLATS